MVKKKKTSLILFAIPFVVGCVFALLNLLTAWNALELRVYDVFLGFKPDVAIDSSLVLLDVDEESIVRTGAWPWPRGLMARGLETMAEFGAASAIFDIEYIERSPMSADQEYLKGPLKDEFDGLFDEVGSNVASLFGALASGNIPLKDAGEYGDMLLELLQDGKTELYSATRKVAIENDSYLGKAMRLFGHASVTLNLQDQRLDVISPELRAIAEAKFSYPNILAAAPLHTIPKDFLIPIMDISSMAAGAGFTNVTIDPDGVRRRIRLVEEIDGKRYLQLAFAPLVRGLGSPDIVFEGKQIVLKGAKLKDRVIDIPIPLDEKGQMLIRWPKSTYEDSFTHVSFYRLLEYRQHEENLVANLRSLRTIEAWALISGANPADAPLAAWDAEENTRQAALESGTPQDRATWLETKARFKKEIAAFLSAGWDSQIPELLDQAKAYADPAEAPLYEALKERFNGLYRNCAETFALTEKQAATLREKLTGAFCVLGWTATATTDMGVNPFNKAYVNVGTHAAVANTILQQDFLDETPVWVGSLASFLLAILVILLIARLSTLYQILVGMGLTLVIVLVNYGIFHFTGVYTYTFAPTLSTFVSFLIYALTSFLISEREKSFLRKAFGTYLSGDVINEIIANPDMLKLGGQKKWITAMFTDVKGFSTISEALDPESLVKLLNLYLSGMSDIVLENRGTIDKYEGDAIISFFGAPLSFQEHAHAACLAAVLMKKKEAELNKQFMADKLTPNPLLTRIGLNTGDMVVGNMGTVRKMDYTIMGNAVNLAARLEGVNKQYGSWILASDATKIEAGDEFMTRRFDRVRVVGINTPVQLWEIVGLRADADDKLLDFHDRFEKAHQVFDTMDWPQAVSMFAALLEENPTDGPSLAYRRRSEEFIKKAPVANWDGVFSLNEK